jgi:hypothetical protein
MRGVRCFVSLEASSPVEMWSVPQVDEKPKNKATISCIA